MRGKSFGVIVGSALCALVIFTLISCGGGSGGDNGDLIISGTLSDGSARAIHLAGTRDGYLGYNVSGLGDSDTTDANGNFQIFGNLSNVPTQTLLTIDSPSGTSNNIVLDTSGSAPFVVVIVFNADGSLTGTVTSGAPNSGTEVPTIDPTYGPTYEPTVYPTATTSSDDGFSEDYDCYCNDGYGPVAPSFTCADTGAHPTNCSPPPTPGA